MTRSAPSSLDVPLLFTHDHDEPDTKQARRPGVLVTVAARHEPFKRCPDGISHFGIERAHDDRYLHEVVGRWVAPGKKNRALTTTGGWAYSPPIRAASNFAA